MACTCSGHTNASEYRTYYQKQKGNIYKYASRIPPVMILVNAINLGGELSVGRLLDKADEAACSDSQRWTDWAKRLGTLI